MSRFLSICADDLIDMIWLLEHCYKLPMVVTHRVVKAVDTSEDLDSVEEIMKLYTTFSRYQIIKRVNA